MPKKSSQSKRSPQKPKEIPFTDLAADETGSRRRANSDTHAAGSAGGGLASGGLAGTNINDGSPDNADLENEFGSGELEAQEESDESLGYGGASGGAVGGSPAGLRSAGGRARKGLKTDSTHRGDSTIGS